jgi:initiation factor 1A
MPPKKSKRRGPSQHDRGKGGELVFKDECQLYCVAIKSLGDRRFEMVGDRDSQPVIGRLRGNMRRSQHVSKGTVVLVSERVDDTSNKVDILMRYSDIHVKMLRKYGELQALDACVAQYDKENEIGGGSSAPAGDADDVEIVFEDDIDALIDDL